MSKNIDYHKDKYIEFKRYINNRLKELYGNGSEYEDADKIVDNLIKNLPRELTGKLFYTLIKHVKLNIDKACKDIFHDYKLKSLPSSKPNSSKLAIFVSGITYADEHIAKAINVTKTHFSNSKNNKEQEELYAYEVYALAKISNILPSQLFEYFYGDGERPIIGLVPTMEEDNKATEQQAAEDESTEEA